MTDERIPLEQCVDPGAKERSIPTSLPERDLAPRSLLEVLSSNWWILLTTVTVATVIGLLVVAKTTPQFVSTARIYVEPSGPKIMREAEEGVMTRSTNYLYTQAELLKASRIIADAVRRTNVSQMRTFATGGNPVDLVTRALTASVGSRDDILSVSFHCPYPQEAAAIVNAVVDAYIAFHEDRKRSTSAEVLKILQKEREKQTQALSEKHRTMIEFKEANKAFALQTDQGNMMVDRLDRLSRAVTEAQLDTLQKKAVYDAARELSDDPERLEEFIQAKAGHRPALQESERIRWREKVDQLQAKITEYSRGLTSEHPLIKSLEKELTEASQQLNRLQQIVVQAELAAMEQDLLATQQREADLTKHFDHQRELVHNFNQEKAQYALLQSEWDQTKQLRDVLDERIRELDVTEDVGVLNITFLEAPKPADHPFAPNRRRYMLVALTAGLLVGAGIALARDILDHRIQGPEEVTAVLDTPLLGTLPPLVKKQNVAECGLAVYLDSTSPIAEALRTLRTAVLFGSPEDRTKTLVVTSAVSGEGKSILVSNLGLILAQGGQKVLILDANMRRPTQHEIFGLDREWGLSAVLTGHQSLGKAVRKGPIRGLDILASGPVTPSPAEMLASPAFKTLLTKLVSKYDRVIIDSPSIMAASDASILAALCTGTLLVVRVRGANRETVYRAKEAMLRVGGYLLGTVLTDVQIKRSRRDGRPGRFRQTHDGMQNGNGQRPPLMEGPRGPGFRSKEGTPPPLVDKKEGQ